MGEPSLSGAVSLLDLLMHVVLAHLTIEYVLVGVFHLNLVHFLLLKLLLSHDAPILILLKFNFFDSQLLLLLFDGEVLHVLLVDACLLVKSSCIVSEVSLLIHIEWIVLKLWHRVELTT